MAVIQKNIRLEGSKGKSKELALFDSGSTYSCIAEEVAKKLEVILKLPRILKFETAKKGEKIIVKERVSLDFYIDNCRFSDEFFVIKNLSEKVIIGASTMQKWRIKLDFEKEKVIIDKNVTKLRLIRVNIKEKLKSKKLHLLMKQKI